jgi:ferredoxin
MPKIIYNKKTCIGAAECSSMSKELWALKSDGKAELKGSVLNPATGNYELTVDLETAKKQEKVARSCPVNSIKVELR